MYSARKCVLCETPILEDCIRCDKCLCWQPATFGNASFEDALNLEKNEGQALDEDGTVLLSNVTDSKYDKITTGPWDACFGGTKEPGIVTTGVYLLGGSPGAGKSTGALQIADAIAKSTGKEILYVGAEEALTEIKNRAKRLGVEALNQFRLVPLGVAVDLPAVMSARKPAAMILDSIQKWSDNLEEQCKICESLKVLAVTLRCPIIVISQVTKADDFAGLNKLKHTVDALLMLTTAGDEVRVLESTKNRYGDTTAMLFDMTEKGLILLIEGEEDNESEETDESD